MSRAQDTEAAAIDWFVRRRTASVDTAAAFEAWLEASPDHAAAYAEVERVWDLAGEAQDDPALGAVRRSAAGGSWLGRRAIAAGLAAGVLGLSSLGIYQLAAPKTLADQSFRTGVGQQASVTLPDGTAVTLNTDTIVRTRADGDRRLVYLDKGQAYFKVAKDRRHPFVVTAAGRTVTALGTAFDVRVDHGGLKVVLVEGKVRVEAVKPPTASRPRGAQTELATEMGAGSQLVATNDTDWRVSRADTGRETSWLHGQIVIDDEPLPVVVAELNRYSNRKIVLADASLETARVSGIFRPGDMDGFARALRTSGIAEVTDASESELHVIALK